MTRKKRPTATKSRARTALVQTRLALDVYHLIARRAQAENRSLGAYLRHVLTALSKAPEDFDLAEQITSHQLSFAPRKRGHEPPDSNPGYISLSGPGPDWD